MSVEHITSGFGIYRASKSYFDAKKKDAKPVKGKEPVKPGSSDEINISDKARELSKKDALLFEFKEALNKLPGPEVRKEKLGQAFTRMVTGYYDRTSVQEKMAETLLNSQGAKKTSHVNPENSTANETVDWQKIKQVQQRIIDNYYDNIDVVNKVVEKLLGS